MRILIGGDLAPTENNQKYFEEGDLAKVIDDALIKKIKGSDLRVYNLETPLADIQTPIRKCGPNLIASEASVHGIKCLYPDLIGLANNHIMDQGEDGYRSTCKALDKEGIAYFGAGKDLNDPRGTYLVEKGGMKIGFYACAEHEYTIAGDDTPGANPYDPLESFDAVKDLKKENDVVIVLYHGGKEFYRYPSPKLQRVCRKFVMSGADLVLCQHTHCVGCEEKYEGKTIVYGQGNFIFDRGNDEFWNSGMLIELEIIEGNISGVEYIPIEKADGRYVCGQKKVLDDFFKRSREICDPIFVKKTYGDYCLKNVGQYLKIFHGHNLLQRMMFKFGYELKIPFHHSKNDLIAIRNYIECEAHQELMIEALKWMTDTR